MDFSALLIAIVSAVVGAIVAVVAEHRVPWFSRWLHRQEEVDKALVQETVRQITALQQTAVQLTDALTLRKAWPLQDEAYREHYPALERLRGSRQLSEALRAAVAAFIAAASNSLTYDDPQSDMPLDERRDSHQQLRDSRDALLALTYKEMRELRQKV